MSHYPVTWITNSLAVGYAPMSYAELASIKDQGINAIVNLCAEFSDLHELEESAGFEVYYLPIWDEDIPEIQEMENALAWLDEAIYLGKKILVHCRHGIGRTGTFVTSYMIRKGLGLKAANKILKKSKANPSSYGQWKLLKKYGKKSGILKIREPSLEIKNRVDLSIFFSDYESLIRNIDKKILSFTKNSDILCGKGCHKCCHENFKLQFIEVVYLHSTINRQFTSIQREELIKRAVESKIDSNKKSSSIKQNRLCPFNEGSGCKIYEIRPVRCRVYGIDDLSSVYQDEIKDMLVGLSRNVFLSFSGHFLLDGDFVFSVSDMVSGKFVQKYFHYMAGIENRILR